MKNAIEKDKQFHEEGEEQLHELIKLAGSEARARKKDALERHLKMLRDAVAEGASRWNKSTAT